MTDVRTEFDSYKNGDRTVAEAEVVDLDAPGQPQESVIFTHPGIVNKLRGLANGGPMVLGRIGQVPTTKGNPAFVLDQYQPGTDDARAQAWLDARPRRAVAQPSAEVPAPADGPVQNYSTPVLPAQPVSAAPVAPAQPQLSSGDLSAPAGIDPTVWAELSPSQRAGLLNLHKTA